MNLDDRREFLEEVVYNAHVNTARGTEAMIERIFNEWTNEIEDVKNGNARRED